MKKYLSIFLFLTVLLLTGCLGGSKSSDYINPEPNQGDVEYINSIIPERDTIQTSILNAVSNKGNNTLKKAPVIGEYYFSLSKEKIDVVGMNATAEIQFIYIENYMQDSNEIEYTGSIKYIYQNEYSGEFYKWVLIDTIVEFFDIETGTLTAKVTFFDEPLANINVYGKSDEEYTKIGVTDQNGVCVIEDILINDYDIYFNGEVYPEKKLENITVNADSNVSVEVALLPYQTKDNCSVYGYVYYDEFKSRPAVNTTVVAYNETLDVDYKPCITDENGYFIINGVQAGTCEIFVKKINNTASDLISINTGNYGSAVRVDDFIITNSDPIITDNSPSNTDDLYFEIGESKRFIVDVYDLDDDNLEYEWKTTGGTLEINKNICNYIASENGIFEISVLVKDNKGGEVSYSWEVECGWIELKGDAPFPGRYGYSASVFDDGTGEKIYVTGGNSGRVRNETLYSEDGANWIINYNMPWAARQNHSSFVFDDGNGERLWIIGGVDAGNNLLSDAWSTSDGLNWVQETDEVNFGARSNVPILKFDNGTGTKLYAIGGSGIYGANSDIWSSEDGINWTKFLENAPFGARTGHECFVKDGKVWLIAGTESGYTKADVWYSYNMTEWFKVVNYESGLYRAYFAVGVLGDHILVTGGHPDYNGTMYSSNDGINWSQVESVPFIGRVTFSIIEFKNSLYLISGYRAYDYTGFKEVWKMRFND